MPGTKINQDEIKDLNHRSAPNEIEAVINHLPRKKIPGPDEFGAELFQTFKEDLVPIFCKLFHKIEREGSLLN